MAFVFVTGEDQTVAEHTGPAHNVRESRGVKARAELSLPCPRFFFLFFCLQPREGVAVLSTAAANKIRLWGGPCPSGSLCVFGKHLVVEEEDEEVGEEEEK